MATEALSTREIAAYCGVSLTTVRKWIKGGKLPAYRLPSGHYCVERPAFRAYLKTRGFPIEEGFFSEPFKRVLIIDDEPAVIEVVSRALQELGKDVRLATACDGFEAGLQVATFKPHLLVLDLMMPGIDGFEVCRLVRQNPATAHIKILVITAYGSHENIRRVLELGADDFMHKPLNLDRLRGVVRRLLADEG